MTTARPKNSVDEFSDDLRRNAMIRILSIKSGGCGVAIFANKYAGRSRLQRYSV
jgi:hypothetical protein